MKEDDNSIIDQLIGEILFVQNKRAFNDMQNVQLIRNIRLAREKKKIPLSKTNLLKSTKSGRHKWLAGMEMFVKLLNSHGFHFKCSSTQS